MRQRSGTEKHQCGDRQQKMPPSAPDEEEESGPLNLSTPYPITLSRVALNNINIKIDDTTVSVLDFTSGLNWQEKR